MIQIQTGFVVLVLLILAMHGLSHDDINELSK